jgi:hypothetical protein
MKTLIGCAVGECDARVLPDDFRACGWTRDDRGLARCPAHPLTVSVRDDAKTCRVTDVGALDLEPSKRTYTPEGYLVVPARIGRAGNVQQYRARELGLDGGDKIIRLHRPADEVFSPETLASFAGKPISDDHPPEGVNAGNWRERAVGDVGPVRRDVDYMLSEPFTVRDAATIEKVKDGKVQLSCGYDFVLDMTPGVTAQGEAYDGVQRRIRGNHVAIVDLARGGPGCRIADNQNQETTMKITIKTVDGGRELRFDVDEKVADSLQDAIDRQQKAIVDGAAALDAVTKDRDGLKAKVAETEGVRAKEQEAAKKKAGDDASEIEKLKARVKELEAVDHEAIAEERAKVIADAKAILGDDVDVDAKGKTTAQIRATALDKVLAADGPAKNVAKAVLGDTEPGKATEKDARMAFDAVVGHVGKVANVEDAALERETSRALAGGKEAQSAGARAQDAAGIEVIRGRTQWMEDARTGKKPGSANA